MQFISERLDSWQAHLEEISHYLVEGEGAWWKWENQGDIIEFLDVNVDGQPHEHPKLENYRTIGLKEMHLAKELAWKSIIDSDIPLPTPRIKLCDEDGNFISHKQFPTVVNANTPFNMEEQSSA